MAHTTLDVYCACSLALLLMCPDLMCTISPWLLGLVVTINVVLVAFIVETMDTK